MNTNDFNILDWFLILVVGGSTLFGFRTGFARVAIGFVAGILGIILGLWFYVTPGAWFRGFVSTPMAADALGFVFVFAAVVLLGGVVARLVAAIFKWAGLTWLDRLLGAGAGFLRGMTIVFGLVAPLLAFALDPTPKFLEESTLLPYTVAFGRVMITIAPKQVRQQFESKAEALKQLWKNEFHPAMPGTTNEPGPHQPTPLKKESY